MSEPVPPAPPVAQAALAAFAHERRAGWLVGDDPIDVAEDFHEASKMHAGFPAQVLGPSGQLLASSHDAHLALGRKALTCTGTPVALPTPLEVPVELIALARQRRSRLPERCAPIPLDVLSTVLAGGAGAVPGRPHLRVNPSAGGLYPLDVVVVAHAVDGLDRGVFVYDPIDHLLLPRTDVDPTRFHRAVGDSIAPASRR